MKKLFVLILLVFTLSVSLHAETIVVVVSANSSQKANQKEIKSFYSGTKKNWSSGDKVALIDQKGGIAESFYKSVVGVSVSKARQMMLKLVLSGQVQAPESVSSDDEVKASLQKNTKAVGYIKKSSVDDSVIVLFELEV